MDKRHFTQFYNDYAERIYKFVYYRVSGNKELAQDLTQDIFVKAFQAFDRYDPAISQTSWLYTIARNHVMNHHAKTRPGVSLEDVEGSVWTSEDFRHRLSNQHDEEKLLVSMVHLSVDDAKLLRMKYLEGWTFEDLEEIFQKKSGALRVQARRALNKLKPHLKNPYAV